MASSFIIIAVVRRPANIQADIGIFLPPSNVNITLYYLGNCYVTQLFSEGLGTNIHVSRARHRLLQHHRHVLSCFYDF